MNIALFASGKGTNVKNILHYFKGNKTVNIAFIGTNNSQSGAIFHAKSYQIPYLILKVILSIFILRYYQNMGVRVCTATIYIKKF